MPAPLHHRHPPGPGALRRRRAPAPVARGGLPPAPGPVAGGDARASHDAARGVLEPGRGDRHGRRPARPRGGRGLGARVGRRERGAPRRRRGDLGAGLAHGPRDGRPVPRLAARERRGPAVQRLPAGPRRRRGPGADAGWASPGSPPSRTPTARWWTSSRWRSRPWARWTGAHEAADRLPPDAGARRMLLYLDGTWEQAAAVVGGSGGCRRVGRGPARRRTEPPVAGVGQVDPGRPRGSCAALERALALACQGPQLPTELDARAALAQLLAAERPAEAAEHLPGATRSWPAGRTGAVPLGQVELARAAVAAGLGDADAADAASARAVEVFTHAPAALAPGRCAGVLGAPPRRPRHAGRGRGAAGAGTTVYAGIRADDRWTVRSGHRDPRPQRFHPTFHSRSARWFPTPTNVRDDHGYSTDAQYDAIVVGARCAGATVATLLARGRPAGAAPRPGRVPQRHGLHPPAVPRLAAPPRRARGRRAPPREHRLRPVEYSWRVLGHAVAGGFTPVGGHDRTYSIRRVTLDAAMVRDRDGGRRGRPVRHRRRAPGRLRNHGRPGPWGRPRHRRTGPGPWVIGADGRTSTVARRLGLPTTQELRGEVSMLFAYWKGLPDSGWCHIDVQGHLSLMSAPCEDGVHLLSVAGPPELTRGSAARPEEAYLACAATLPRRAQPPTAGAGTAGLPRRRRAGDDAARVRPAGHRPGLGPGRRRRPVQAPGDRAGDRRRARAGLVRRERARPWRGPRRLPRLARGPRRRPLRVVLRGRPFPVAGRCGGLRRTRRRPGGGPGVPRHLRAAAPSRRGADPGAPGPVAGRLGVREGPGRAPGPPRRARRRGHGRRWSPPARLDRRRPPGPPRRRGRGRVAGGLLRRGHGGLARPVAGGARDAWTDQHLRRPVDRSRDALLCGLHLHGGRVVQSLRRGDGPLAAGPAWMVAAPVATSPCTWPTCGRRWEHPRTPTAPSPGSGSAPTGTGCTSASWRRPPRHPAHRRPA